MNTDLKFISIVKFVRGAIEKKLVIMEIIRGTIIAVSNFNYLQLRGGTFNYIDYIHYIINILHDINILHYMTL